MERAEDYARTDVGGDLDEGANMNMETSSSMSVRDSEGAVRWVGIARNAYETSTDYFDANIRKQIEKNIKLFQSRHPAGSKYHQPSFKFRSKIFRPKTRTVVRRHQAAASLAFFSTADTVSCTAENQRSPEDRMGAEFAKNLIQYRLEHSIPWFQTVIGGYQDSMNQGVVISRQEWIYSTKEMTVQVQDTNELGLPITDLLTGEPQMKDVKQVVIDKDHPDIVLIPVENFRFDPACDWRDPAGTSPYLIELMPMYVHQVKERMEQDNPKTGEKKWKKLDDGKLKSSKQTGDFDSTRMVREGQREDSKDIQHETGLFDIVWVHRNIVRVEGVDYLYYTLGTEFLLSEPVEVEEAYLHGRPYAVGVSEIETHKTYPAGSVELGQDLQAETNDIANQRLDNIKLALNKRYLAKRGSNVDWRALTTSTPGGIILMDDLNHVKEESMTDVTQSSYQEQDRINVDYDELMGNFSQSSVATNNALNKTLGGQHLAADDSNILTEFQLRVLTETWIERVLKQLHAMEVNYETDERILEIAGAKALMELGNKPGKVKPGQEMPQPGEMPDPNAPPIQSEPPQPTPEAEVPINAANVSKLIARPISVRVDVGFGATSPHKRVEKLDIGLSIIAKYAPQKIQQISFEEISKEVFGALGFRDGSRFFNDDEDIDPQVAQLEKQLQQMQQMLESKQMEMENKLQVAQMNNQTKMQTEQMKSQTKLQSEQFRAQANERLTMIKGELDYIQRQIAAETNDIKRGELELQKIALEWKKKVEEVNMLAGERDKMRQNIIDDDQRMYERSGAPASIGGQSEGDGLVDDRGSTVMANDNYGLVPQAEG